MFQAGDIYKTIVHSNKNDRNVYLNFMEHNIHGASTESQAQLITHLLFKSKSRLVGFRFLIEFLKQCSNNVLKEKAMNWLTIIARSCNIKEVGFFGDLIYEALALLVVKIQPISEVAKWFGSNCIGRIYESLSFLSNETSTNCTISALKAINQCLQFYPGPSKFGKPIIMEYLLKLVDSSSPEVIYQSGICWLNLQQVRGNFNAKSNHDATQVKDFQIGLLGNLHELLNDVDPCFKNNKKSILNHKLDYFNLETNADPVERTAKIFRRFHNLIEYLKIVLSHPFPSMKQICQKKILNLVQHGLELKNAQSLSYENVDAMCFENLLPQMHTKLLELLEVLINISQTHLRLHFRLVSSIVLDSMQKTLLTTPEGHTIHFISFRIQVYKVIESWVTTFGEGSGFELIADRLVNFILEDLVIRRQDIFLVSNIQSKNNFKRRKLMMPDDGLESEIVSDKNKHLICREALVCLRAVLSCFGFQLSPHLLNNILTSLLETRVLLYQKRISRQNVYNDRDCRIELLKTLFTFIKLRNVCIPTNIILHVLEESSRKDSCFEVRSLCKSMIASTDKIIHPQRESFIFKTDPNDKKYGLYQNLALHYTEEMETSQSNEMCELLPENVDLNLNESSPENDPTDQKTKNPEESFNDILKKENTMNNLKDIAVLTHDVADEKKNFDENKRRKNKLDDENKKRNIVREKSNEKRTPKITMGEKKDNQITGGKAQIKNGLAVEINNFECSKSDLIPKDVNPSNKDDESCIAELQAAFVDEFI